MMKRDKMNADFAKVSARYSKTTGASTGAKPAPKAKVVPIVKKNTVGIKITKKF